MVGRREGEVGVKGAKVARFDDACEVQEGLSDGSTLSPEEELLTWKFTETEIGCNEVCEDQTAVIESIAVAGVVGRL